MRIEYLPSFIKDLKALRGTPVYKTIYQLAFDEIPNMESLSEIPNIKKLKGYSDAYRLRVGDYRVGFFLNDDTLQIARALHRREIYRYFP